MDWLLETPQMHSAFSALGSLEGDTFIIGPKALAILDEINLKLTYEDQYLRTFRCAIGFGQNVRTDLIPLLENAKDDAVLDAVIRILVNLTAPVECLFSVEAMYRTEVGRHTLFEVNKLLYTSKEAFTDSKSTKHIIDFMKQILESDTKLSPQKCEQINNCLLLLRNILIPEANNNYMVPTSNRNLSGTYTVSMQNKILWNIFVQSIDKLLLYLMACPERAFWGVTIVQLIALMYKDQHISTLQKLLNLWFDASLTESSEDNESNTSPPKQGSGDSSPMLTSDPTSDFSDNGSGSRNKRSEDRRQALREETDATLQEVSRRGQEYQDFQEYQESIISAPILENSNSSISSPNHYVAETVLKQQEEAEKDEDKDKPEHIITIQEQMNQKFKQPVNNKIHTTTSNGNKNEKSHCNTFKKPPAVLHKNPVMSHTADITDMESISSDSISKPHQKVSHAGQLHMTKGKSCPQKRACSSSQSEISDCGYGTQAENQELISTSSNDDDDEPQSKPQHQKPPCNTKPRKQQRTVLNTIDKNEIRRKKLVRRGKSSLINMKGLIHHTPTDEDISNLLKEFTVDFLLKGFGHLVEELHKQLLSNVKIPIDTSHFFWLITYFLKFAAQLELELEHLNTILNYDLISYLTYEGVTLCEQLELSSRQKESDLKPYLRRMHLVVTAIREFLQAIEAYKKITHLTEADRERLQRLQADISSTEDLRCLFVLLLSRFNPNLQTKQYLQDVVVTNHLLLMTLDSVTSSDDSLNNKIIEHLSQFATMEVMHHYGMLLEDFHNNGAFLNDCIFTMMHHVSGDLEQMSTLFQPIILKTFSKIWEDDYELCDDWSDMIHYVINRFMKTPQKCPTFLPTTSLTEMTKEHNLKNSVCTWTREEMNTLYWYYVQSKNNNDVVGKILNLFTNNGNKQKSRISIINQLLQQDIITLAEYDDLMKFEDAEYQRTFLTSPTSCNSESGIETKSSVSKTEEEKTSDNVQIFRDFFIKENKGKHLKWLQKLLLECCYIKMVFKKTPLREDQKNLKYIMEPVAYHAILKSKSIPIVQWNYEQAATMLYQPFVLLLHKLGVQLPADAGSIFPRIPGDWTAETMFDIAKKLGPVDKLNLKFDACEFDDSCPPPTCSHETSKRSSLTSLSSIDTENYEMDFDARSSSTSGMLSPVAEIEVKDEKAHEIFAVPKAKHSNLIIRYTPDPSPMPPVPNWLQLVMRSKCNAATSFIPTSTTVITPKMTTTSSVLAVNQRIIEITPLTVTSAGTATATLTATTAMHQHLTTTTTAANMAVAATLATTVATKQQKMQQNTITTHLPYSKRNELLLSVHECQKMHSNEENNSTIPATTLLRIATNMNSATTFLSHKKNNTTTFEQYQKYVSDDDTTMKSLDRNGSISSGYVTRSLESDCIAMVAAGYENEIANSDTASVASDLTRMYVSDEDEHSDF